MQNATSEKNINIKLSRVFWISFPQLSAYVASLQKTESIEVNVRFKSGSEKLTKLNHWNFVRKSNNYLKGLIMI